MISLYSVPPLISSLLFIALGMFVLGRNRASKLNQDFFLLCSTTFLWQFSWALLFNTDKTQENILLLTKVGYTGILFLPIAYFRFIVHFVNSKSDKLALLAGYVFCVLTVTLVWTTNLIINGYEFHKWGPYPRAGLFHPAYLVVLGGLFLRGLKLFRKDLLENASLHRKAQTKYLIWALLVYIPAASDFIVNYGLDFYPLGFIFITAFLIITGLGIAKHQLLDIDVVIRRATVFAGLFAFVYGTFSVVTIIGQEFFHKYLGWNQWVSTIPTVLIITFALRPLENYLTNITDRFLFQKKYDYRDLLRTFTNEVLTVLDLEKLTEQTISELSRILKLESVSIFLLHKESKSYRLAAQAGLKNRDVSFGVSDALIEHLHHSNQAILKEKSVDHSEGHSYLRDDFKKINAQLCLPISLHDEMTGILCLGMKKSGEDYTPEDIDILSTLAKTLAIALANAQLFDQLSKTQAEAAQREKMAVIGTLAAGINHEICNPLGIVRGQCEMFLLNLRDGIYAGKSTEQITGIASEIMNKVIKETDRATAITKKLSGFAKPAKKIENEEVFVEKEADEVLGLIGHDLKLNNIEFTKSFPNNFPPIFADRRQIQEVLFNIIRNAAQAMDKKDGSIELVGSVNTDKAYIRISDNGSGIPADKLETIFHPFYTTKEPGKGTGLGLFIVKQVIERNNGTISVESIEGAGTTFTLAFPIAIQAKVLAA